MRVKHMPNLLLLKLMGFHWIGMHLADFLIHAKLGALRCTNLGGGIWFQPCQKPVKISKMQSYRIEKHPFPVNACKTNAKLVVLGND